MGRQVGNGASSGKWGVKWKMGRQVENGASSGKWGVKWKMGRQVGNGALTQGNIFYISRLFIFVGCQNCMLLFCPFNFIYNHILVLFMS